MQSSIKDKCVDINNIGDNKSTCKIHKASMNIANELCRDLNFDGRVCRDINNRVIYDRVYSQISNLFSLNTKGIDNEKPKEHE